MSYFLPIVWALALIYTILLIHELGHFLPAYFLRQPVSKFIIGEGPFLYACVWKGIRFEFYTIPFGGSVHRVWPSKTRWKNAVISGGGPAANLICAALFWQSDWKNAFASMSLIMGCCNLIWWWDGSDGQHILQELRRTPQGVLTRKAAKTK